MTSETNQINPLYAPSRGPKGPMIPIGDPRNPLCQQVEDHSVRDALITSLYLNRMKQIIDGEKEFTLSDQDYNKLIAIKNKLKLPENLQVMLPRLDKESMRRPWLSIVEACRKSIPAQIKDSQDIGGHGGTLKATLGDQKLFLKPKDPVEACNYRLLEKLVPELIPYMPKVHDEITIGDKTYLILDDLVGMGTPLVDIKLAGRLQNDKDFHPICSQGEMRTTRKKEKPKADYLQMKVTADMAPDYMIAVPPRFVNYADSQITLTEKLKGTSKAEYKKLFESLVKIQGILKRSPVALIGSSLFLVKERNGEIKIKLIDPAHLQVAPNARGLAGFDLTQIYFGIETDPHEFNKRQISNQIALESLVNHVAKLFRDAPEGKEDSKESPLRSS